MTRAFIALDLPREAINEIGEIQKKLEKKKLFIGKFTEGENLHLTLKFLGEIDEKKIGEVKERLKKINFPEFRVSLGNVGVFSKKFIKIIWIKLDGEVFQLQKQIDEKLKDLFKTEERFMSHITIARVKKVFDKTLLVDYLKKVKTKKFSLEVNKFFLKKSELFPDGPVYDDLQVYNLRNIVKKDI